MNKSFETMSMNEILNYVSNTEYNLQNLQQNLNETKQQIDVLWDQMQKLENDKKKYILEKSNDTDWKNLNLYSGTSELSKKYLHHINLLRNHLTDKGYDLYDKPDNKCAGLVFQSDYFINQVFVFYGISKTKVIDKSFIDVYREGETHQAKEALQTDEFKNYSDSISALVKKLNIPQNVIDEINSEQWKYENGKISPELSEATQKFFYDVISKLDIYKNSLKRCLQREFEKNSKLEIKDNERISLKQRTVEFENQIRLETDPDNENSSRNKLKFNFVEFLKRDDCIKCVLDYANKLMPDENKKALETLCSFKYWHPNKKKPNYYESLLTWYICDSVFFCSLSNDNKKKVLDTLRSFWNGFLKNQDKKDNKQLTDTKLKPDESKDKIKNYENDKNKIEPQKDEKRKIVQNFLDTTLNNGNKKNFTPKKSAPLNVVTREVGKNIQEKNTPDIKEKKEFNNKKKNENDKHSKNNTGKECLNQEIKILTGPAGKHNSPDNDLKPPLPRISKTKYVLIKWRDNFLKWLQNLWYSITGQNKMWVYTQQNGEAENLKLSLLEDKNSIVNLLNECQDKSKKTFVVARSSGNNIETK